MAAGSFTVIGIGAATLDALSIVPEFRAEEHVTQALAHAEDGGGPVATALCVLSSARHACALIDRCGDDVTGQKIRAGLVKFGVSTNHLRVVPGTRSASASILVRQRDGARQIVYASATAGEPTPDEVDAALFTDARLLHLNGRHETAARHAVKLAQQHGVTISFDGGADRWRESLRDLIAASHIRIVAREFAERCTGLRDLQEIAAALLQSPAQIVVITEGMRGSHVWTTDGSYFHQPAFTAAPLIDTTGCGDVFHGAFLHGWLSNWPVERCAEHASRLAAKNAAGLGGRHALNTER
ncbi:MAG: carbohydrate kinase family protein [Prosthecobacter sp.]|uniref:carbohydrate kinase family protein n=1 Tax=Prosthecobacter sp. TaxID=1965333 RepID=UPI0039022460